MHRNIKILITVCIFGLIVIWFIWFLQGIGLAEDQEVWVLCQPQSYVSLRCGAGKTKGYIGGASCGSKMLTDGKIKNGFLHVYDLHAEDSSGWISIRYIVYDEPIELMEQMKIVSDGRVAARSWINGKIIKWLKNDDVITVYWASDEWSITNKGYIKSEFIGRIYTEGE